MLGLDRTGSEGEGSKTGRGMGTCVSKTLNPENNSGQNNKGFVKNLQKRLSIREKIGGRDAGLELTRVINYPKILKKI